MARAELDLFSPSPGKRAVERAWLAYTPVWGAITGVVMLSGLAERWGDVELLAFGIVLALGCVLAALPWGETEREARRDRLRAALAMTSGVVVLSFGLNYFQTPYFFDVLHMRYGFATEWEIDRNPIFLYLVTIPYFATYSVLACMAVRAARWWAGDAVIARAALYAAVPFALAFLETVLNANPFMTRLFCYDDLGLMLSFGTLSYGVSFVLALPAWMVIEEGSARSWPVMTGALLMALVVVADTTVLWGLRAGVAPALATVVEGTSGDAGEGGCLAR